MALSFSPDSCSPSSVLFNPSLSGSSCILGILCVVQTVKKKRGLQSPIAKWMKKELQPFLHDILNKNYYDNSKNYLNFNNIENLLKRHKEEYHNPHLIWSLVTFQIFLKKFKL